MKYLGLSETKLSPREKMEVWLQSISEDYHIDRRAFAIIVVAAEKAFRPVRQPKNLTHGAFMIYLKYNPKSLQSVNKRLEEAGLEILSDTSWERLLRVVKETKLFFKMNPDAGEPALIKHLKRLDPKLTAIESATITSILNSAGIPHSLED